MGQQLLLPGRDFSTAENFPIFVTGAEDPEMDAIKARLIAEGIGFYQAVDLEGRNVSAGEAYTNASVPLPRNILERNGIAVVEAWLPKQEDLIVVSIDHHRRGDRGYDMPPSEAVAASSIGQLAAYFGFELTERERAIGAVDHNFYDVLRGRVPDIEPEYGAFVYMDSIAREHNVDIQEIEQVVGGMRLEVIAAPKIEIAGIEVSDLTHTNIGKPNSITKLTILAAAALEQQPILIRFLEGPYGPEKVSINWAQPEVITEFHDKWVPATGLVNGYMVPKRFYGGGYLPEGVEWVPPSDSGLTIEPAA